MASDNLDDFKLDGLDDLDLDMDDPFDSLRGKSKIKALTMGILSGAKSELTNFGFIAKTVRKSIPDSFRRSLDNSDNIKFGVGNSYNKIAQDYKHEFNDLKSIMPDSIASLLPKGEEDYSYSHDPDSSEEANYTAGINTQLEQNEKIASGRLKRDNNVDRMKIRGQTLQVEHLKGIGDRLSAGLRSTSLGLRMAEKSLEVQYRHYNVALKTYELIHNSSKSQLRALADIIRNTSLSDSVKHSIAMGNKGGVGGKIASRFMGGAGKRMSGKAMDLLSSRFGMVSPMISQVNMMRSMGDMGGMMNPWEMGGEIIGGLLAEMGGEYVSDKVKTRLGKDNRLNKYGKKAGNITASAMARARYASTQRFKTEYYMPQDAGMGSRFKNWMKQRSNGMMDNLNGAFDGGLQDRSASNFKGTYNDASTVSVHTNKSLTTIIPGYLARILREVTVANTGNQNTNLLSYSVDRDRFVTQKRKSGDLIRTLKDVKKSTNTTDIKNAVSGMDPTGMLSASAKKAMEIQLLHGASNDMNFYGKNFTDSTYYHEGISKRDRSELIRFFRKHNFDGLEFNEANEALIDSTRSSKDDLDRMYQMMDMEIQKGNLDGLVTMGLVKRDRTGQPNFDEKAIYEFMLGTKGDKATFAKLVGSTKVRASGAGADNLKSFYASARAKEDTSGNINIKGFGEIKGDVMAAGRSLRDSANKALDSIRPEIAAAKARFTGGVDYLKSKVNIEDIKRLRVSDVLSIEEIKGLSVVGIVDQADIKSIRLDDVLNASEIKKVCTEGMSKSELAVRVKAYAVDVNSDSRVVNARNVFSGKIKSAADSVSGVLDIDRIKKMTLSDVLDTVDIKNMSIKGIVDAADIRRISLTDVLHIDDIKKVATSTMSKEQLKKKVIDYIASKSAMAKDTVNGVYNSSEAYLGTKADVVAEYSRNMTGNAKEYVKEHRANASSDDVISYQSSVLDLLRAISTSSAATEANTREIKVYVGDDVTASTTSGIKGGRQLWIPGLNSMRKLGGAGVDLLVKGMGMYGSMLGGLGNAGGSLLKGAGNIVGDMMSSMTNIGRVKDIYLRDGIRKHPVMLARDIKAGLYIDVKTKKTIKKLKDIKGEVVDTAGNVVVQESELDKLYTLDGQSVVSRISGLVGGTMVNLLKPSFYISKAVASGVKAITGGYRRPKDIYVLGEKQPRMNAIGLKSGIYFNKTDSSVIKSVNDIKGPVIDFEGNEVVSARDLSSLVGADGKPIESLRYKVFNTLAGIVVTPFKLAFKLGSAIVTGGFKALIKTGAIAKSELKRRFGKSKVSTVDQAIASETNGILTAIYTLLHSRLPDPNRKWNDTDGDGYREGSFLAKKNEPTAAEKAAMAASGSDAKKASGAGFFASMMAKMTGKKEDENDGDGDTFIDASGSGDDKDKKGNKGKNKKPAGKMGKIWNATKGFATKYGGTALKFGAMLGMSALMSGSGLAMAGTALSVAGTALAGAAAAVLSVISLPVVVVGAVVAGVAVGGYYLYKYLSGRPQSFGDLFKLRLAQYGVSAKNKEQVDAIIRLEGMLIKDTSIVGVNGVISTDDKKAAEIIKLFKVNTRDPKSMARWGAWFNQRFKPVYLGYINGIKAIATNATLGDIDEKLTVSEKIRLLEYVNFDASEGSPMSITAGPFGLGSIVHGGEAMVMRDDLIAKLNKMPKDSNKKVNARGRTADSSGHKYVDTTVGTVAAINSGRVRQRGQVGSAAVVGPAGKSSPAAQAKINIPNSPMRSNSNVVPIGAAGGFAAAANSGNWGLPVKGAISSPFGMRNDPFSGKPKGHGGVDFAASQGTPIYATANGTITRREYSQSYGNVVYINHPDGLQSRYAHMHSFNPAIKTGDVITKGTLVGYVGNTGHSAGNHLHFEIIDLSKNGKKLDPLAVINDSASKVAIKQLATEEKEIAKEVKESRSKDTIEGVNTIASTITKEPARAPKDIQATDRLAQLTSIQTLNTETSMKIESRREQREFENTKTFQNSMDRAVAVMEQSLAISRNSNEILMMINSNMGTVAKEIVAIGGMRNNVPASIASAPKRPTSLSMDRLPVNNTRPV